MSREESDFVRDLELCQKYITRVRRRLLDKKTGSPVFVKTVRLLLAGIRESLEVFRKEIEQYDCREHTRDNQDVI